jgi:hypothetical protein
MISRRHDYLEFECAALKMASDVASLRKQFGKQLAGDYGEVESEINPWKREKRAESAFIFISKIFFTESAFFSFTALTCTHSVRRLAAHRS